MVPYQDHCLRACFEILNYVISQFLAGKEAIQVLTKTLELHECISDLQVQSEGVSKCGKITCF